jgi:hypothetical protein
MVLAAMGVVALHGVTGHGVADHRDKGRVDAVAVRGYLAVTRGTLLATERRMGTVENAMAEVAARVRRTCPAGTAGAPVRRATWRVDAEVGEELGVVAAHVEVGLAERFTNGVKRLRWNDRQIAAPVERTARAITLESRLPRPPVCTVLGEWARDGFHRLPGTLEKFTKAVESLSEASELMPGPFTRYASQLDLAGVRDVQKLEGVVSKELRRAIRSEEDNIVDAVGLQPAGHAAGVSRFRPEPRRIVVSDPRE